MSDTEDDVGVLIAVKDAALKPVKAAVSPRARRAYISTALFVSTAFLLLGFATIAYIAFYYYYVPIRGFTQPIHFHWKSPEADPQAILVPPPSNIVSDQPYDIKVFLNLPRSVTNLHRGNFMVDVKLLSPTVGGSSNTLAHSIRPTILTYYSPLLEYARKAVALPLYVFGWRREEEQLQVSMLEHIVFRKGWQNIPASIKVELVNAAHVQIYDASITFKARLRGLRYLMYNWRLTSFVIFTSIFWGFELFSAGLLWLSLIMITSSATKPPIKQEQTDSTTIKQEPGTTTDEPTVKIKEEDQPLLHDYPAATEADVESEEAELPVIVNKPYRGASDSGIGTSLESSASRSDYVRKRSSRSNFSDDR